MLEASAAVLSAEWFDWKSHVARPRHSPHSLPLHIRCVTERTILPDLDFFAPLSICSHLVCSKCSCYSYLRPFGNEPSLQTLSHAKENVTWQSANASLGLIRRIWPERTPWSFAGQRDSSSEQGYSSKGSFCSSRAPDYHNKDLLSELWTTKDSSLQIVSIRAFLKYAHQRTVLGCRLKRLQVHWRQCGLALPVKVQ